MFRYLQASNEGFFFKTPEEKIAIRQKKISERVNRDIKDLRDMIYTAEVYYDNGVDDLCARIRERIAGKKLDKNKFSQLKILNSNTYKFSILQSGLSELPKAIDACKKVITFPLQERMYEDDEIYGEGPFSKLMMDFTKTHLTAYGTSWDDYFSISQISEYGIADKGKYKVLSGTTYVAAGYKDNFVQYALSEANKIRSQMDRCFALVSDIEKQGKQLVEMAGRPDFRTSDYGHGPEDQYHQQVGLCEQCIEYLWYIWIEDTLGIAKQIAEHCYM